MQLTYDSHVIKLSAVDWKSDHERVARALRTARGRGLVLRASQAAEGKRDIPAPAGPDQLDRAIARAGIDPAHPFDLEIVIRQPVPGAPLREALQGGHGYRDGNDQRALRRPGATTTAIADPSADAVAAFAAFAAFAAVAAESTGAAAPIEAPPAAAGRPPHSHPHPLRRAPMFFRDHGGSVDLVDLHRGASVFLILNGPSFARVDHARLRQPGVLTFGVNNGAHGFRPHYWTCVDDPTRFMESIWRDPTLTKFVPMGHFEKPAWDTRAGRVTVERVRDFPNVIGYRRNECFQPERWLTEDTVNWGNHAERGGGRSVMLAALRLCHLLGFRRVFLLGCDFHMDETHGYWFPEHRGAQAIRNNTTSYRLLTEAFAALRPHLDAAGFEVLNCTEGSRLDPGIVPPYPLDQALAETTLDLSASTEGMYVDRFKTPDSPAPSRPVVSSSPSPAPTPDTGIRASVLAAIGAAPIQADPFFHLTLEKVFPPETYAALPHHLPDATDYEDLRHRDAMRADGTSARLHLILTPESLARLPQPIRDFWTPIHAALTSPEVRQALFARHYPALFRRFGKQLRDLRVEPRLSLIRDLAGYRIGIHKDIDQKVITTQFYLPRDESQAHLGTKFYRRAERPTLPTGAPEPPTEEPEPPADPRLPIKDDSGPAGFTFAKQMRFLPNSGYSFTVAPDSFHGVDPLAAEDAPRDSVMLVYYLKKSA